MKFSPSYNPADFETDIYAAWEASSKFLPAKMDRSGKTGRESKRYSIVMPPPNANGNLHIGHGLTVAIEDSLTRYYRLRGRRTWYIPGADHAGFETWVVYERELEKQGKTRFMFSRDELYARVWDFVQEKRGVMELQLRALGASCSWKDLTFTLDENVIRQTYRTFEKMWKEGLIYRGEKLVNYCTKHQTAFADIEVEYKEEEGKLYEIKYPLVEDDGYVVISTTRPETLFGDVAVAVNPADERYKEIVGKSVSLPLSKREIPVISDQHADMEYGTGAVKITPAHDVNDFEVGERHKLPRISVIGFDGKMLPICGPDYEGLSVLECRKKVLRDLETAGLLVGEKKIRHAVAHCYKCGTVIEPMLKKQWFVDTSKLAKLAISHLDNNEIKFYPENKQRVLINYLESLKDWNISRQIPWGIAIPMFRKLNPNDLGDEWIFDTRTNLSEIEIGGVKYVRDEDTFDTWFSSSHWPIVCTNWEEGVGSEFYPLNVMETGADILFAWVARMIMVGIYVTGEVPFKEVYLHGLVLDAHGKKMSKSKGNVINPMEMIMKYGSDAFRLGILRGRSAGLNQAFSEKSVISGRNLCNKLWNISRFVQGIVDDEEKEKGFSETDISVVLDEDAGSAVHQTESDSINPEVYQYTTNNMGEDWICREINQARGVLEQCMAEYRFSEAVETIYELIWDKYADWFLESQKLFKNISLLKVSLESILIMLHPFAPFVTEAIWQNLSWTDGMIIDQMWPSLMNFDLISGENFERLIEVVSNIRGMETALAKFNRGKKFTLLVGEDILVNDNLLLVKFLSRVPAISSTNGAPRGLRLAIANHELYLDVPERVIVDYKDELENKILAIGKELDNLNARMMNPRYVEKAPAGLVRETRNSIVEKEELIEKMKSQLNII
mgnify:FL=1